MSHDFSLRIVTPFGEIFAGRALALSLQGKSWHQTILAGHAPLVASVDGSVCSVREEGGKARTADVGEGVLAVSSEGVLLVCEKFAFAEE